MKKIFSALLLLLTFFSAHSQQELQIHHINVENGDATMIVVYDHGSGYYTAKVLIDGGMSTPGLYLLPYLKNVGGAMGSHFNYIILTHYHSDHYTGLDALGNGALTADSVIDPGGYNFSQYFPGQAGLTSTEAKLASMVVAPQWTSIIGKAMSGGFLKGRSQALVSFGISGSTSLGRVVKIGDVGGLPVTLEGVAGWGNTLSNGPIIPDPLPAKPNLNNFSLAFVLQCGEFRYFIGGDLGGSNQDLYIDQEDALTGYLNKAFPAEHAINGQPGQAGHICGFKADHHCSNYANTTAFMDGIFPAITVTSAGNESSWHLPQVNFLTTLSAVQPVSPGRGVYFTNLYNWGAGKNSLTTAQTLFASKPGISFDYGNPAGHKYSYMILVKPDNLSLASDFEVDRVDITQASPYTLLAKFQCHKQ